MSNFERHSAFHPDWGKSAKRIFPPTTTPHGDDVTHFSATPMAEVPLGVLEEWVAELRDWADVETAKTGGVVVSWQDDLADSIESYLKG